MKKLLIDLTKFASISIHDIDPKNPVEIKEIDTDKIKAKLYTLKSWMRDLWTFSDHEIFSKLGHNEAMKMIDEIKKEICE